MIATTVRSAVALAAALVFALPAAQAASLSYTGTTAGGPTFDRPIETLDFLPAAGMGANYHAYEFSVDTTGFYEFLSLATGGWDNFTLLYGPGFNPASSLTGALVANDDLGMTPGASGFTWALTAGTTYTFVTTGFAGGMDAGGFSNNITGPGGIAPVPEPGTWALLVGGLALIGFEARRRRS